MALNGHWVEPELEQEDDTVVAEEMIEGIVKVETGETSSTLTSTCIGIILQGTLPELVAATGKKRLDGSLSFFWI